MAIKKVKKNENRTTKKGSYPRMVTLSDWLLLETLPKKNQLKKSTLRSAKNGVVTAV